MHGFDKFYLVLGIILPLIFVWWLFDNFFIGVLGAGIIWLIGWLHHKYSLWADDREMAKIRKQIAKEKEKPQD